MSNENNDFIIDYEENALNPNETLDKQLDGEEAVIQKGDDVQILSKKDLENTKAKDLKKGSKLITNATGMVKG